MINAQADRKKDIDTLKGVAIIFVLWGHAIQYLSQGLLDFYENPIFRFIYGFHMPLFMYVSGYLFWLTYHKYSYALLVKKVLKNIAYPLIIWNVIISGVHIIGNPQQLNIFREDIEWLGIIKILISFFSCFWFLWSLLFCELLLATILCLSKSTCQLVLGMLIGTIFLGVIPWQAEMNCWMFPYFCFGYFIHNGEKKYKDFFSNFKLIGVIGSCCVILYFVLLTGFHKEEFIYISGITKMVKEEGWLRQIVINLFRWALGFVGVIGWVWSIKLIYFNGGTVIKKFLDKIGSIGKNTLQIYILQNILLERFLSGLYICYIDKLNLQWITKNIYLFDLIITPGAAIIILCLCLLIIKVTKFLKLNYLLFGR